MNEEEIRNIIKQILGIENSMAEFQKKAEKEIQDNGVVAKETQTKIDNLGVQQKEIADRLLAVEQQGTGGNSTENTAVSIGAQFTDSDAYKNFIGGSAQKARVEIENNTNTGSDATVAPDRKAGIVPGAAQILTLENLLVTLPTSSNAIEYTKEATFVNNAAAVAEAGDKPETDITFSLENMPVSTVAHWTKISKQLAADAPALAAYINFRMTYGVNQKAESDIANGDGVGANISGLFLATNYTAHGIADADLGTVLKKHVLIRKVIAQLYNTGYMADAIVLNPIDYADMEIDEAVTANVKGISFSIPVVQSSGVTQGQFLVGAFQQAATVHNRQATTVELSESDGDNFTKNLITVRAERRLALTVEVPAAIMGGDLEPL